MAFGLSGMFSRKESMSGNQDRFDRFKTYNNKELDLLVRKHLDKDDRRKFNQVIEGKIKIGRTLSADKILMAIGSEHGYEFKKKIKNKVFTVHDDGRAEAERLRQRNILRTKMDRLREEVDPLASQDYHSATPDKLEHRNTFFQPGSNAPSDAEVDHNNYPSVLNKTA